MSRQPAQAQDRFLLGVDTGGTFTDFVLWRPGEVDKKGLETCKVLSTPDDPSRAIRKGMEKMGIGGRDLELVHGTTVGTNAVLEGKGARVVFITNTGFADMLTLARQNRDDLYSLAQPPVAPPVPGDCCIEVPGRRNAQGDLLDSADEEDFRALAEQVESLDPEAVAVNLLFSFLNPESEEAIARALGNSRPVSLSSSVLPEIREYERGIATWLNAAIGPKLSGYLSRLSEGLSSDTRLSVMQSDGTTVEAEQATRRAVHLLLSGPAGGLAAAASIGEQIGEEQLLTFDMGGTSTDVALVSGRPVLTRRGRIGPYPVAVPMVDMETIGAGGGSLARVDQGGALRVGPDSAGADPGPACYGQGGTQATVTDAHVFLGHVPGAVRLGGSLEMDRNASAEAIQALARSLDISPENAARGILTVANENMSRALRVMSAERGLDPAGLALMSFGGAGGLHVCDLAESLGIRQAVVPARSGVLSALGMLVAEPGRNLTASLLQPATECSDETLQEHFGVLEAQAARALEQESVEADERTFVRQVECRYQGQDATLMVEADRPSAMAEAFEGRHEAQFGYRLDLAVELVTLNLEARGQPRLGEIPPAGDAGPGGCTTSRVAGVDEPVRVIGRGSLETGRKTDGPLIVIDDEATTWIAPGWRVCRDRHGHLLLSRTAPKSEA